MARTPNASSPVRRPRTRAGHRIMAAIDAEFPWAKKPNNQKIMIKISRPRMFQVEAMQRERMMRRTERIIKEGERMLARRMLLPSRSNPPRVAKSKVISYAPEKRAYVRRR